MEPLLLLLATILLSGREPKHPQNSLPDVLLCRIAQPTIVHKIDTSSTFPGRHYLGRKYFLYLIMYYPTDTPYQHALPENRL